MAKKPPEKKKAPAKKKTESQRVTDLHKTLDRKQKKNLQRYRRRKAKLDQWRKDRIKAVRRRGGSAETQRKSINKIESRYNRRRKEIRRKFVRVRRRLAYPQVLNSRNTTDIFEHYHFQRLLSMDATRASINDVVTGQIPGTNPYIPESYGEHLEAEYGNKPVVLNLGVTDISALIEWEQVYDAANVLTYTAHIEIPNSEGFYEIVASISPM